MCLVKTVHIETLFRAFYFHQHNSSATQRHTPHLYCKSSLSFPPTNTASCSCNFISTLTSFMFPDWKHMCVCVCVYCVCVYMHACDEYYVISDIYKRLSNRQSDRLDVTEIGFEGGVVGWFSKKSPVIKNLEYTGGRSRAETESCQTNIRWSELVFGPNHSFGPSSRDSIL